MLGWCWSVELAELIRLAVTSRSTQFSYLATVAVTFGADESADIRTACPVRELDGGYADGYGASKWAGEVLLRAAHDAYGLPVAVFRSNLILAHPRYRGRLNVADVFTRLVLSLLATGIAPGSFYAGGGGARGRGHYDGFPVDFAARAIAALGDGVREGHHTYNVVRRSPCPAPPCPRTAPARRYGPPPSTGRTTSRT
ncbi:SDR family oxidoreductase [Streptomyces buecherae]|uniref:SDR family oxidoreductase n=1 Tax=Streptomyces buecherae TaxID=2763006 RepID=UPI0027E1A200|nr:SDR family oxidoreductase [Streptomyces buecherae]